MILVINVNEHELHGEEFVRPVTDLLDNFKVVHYKEMNNKDLEKSDKIIICGTALKDNEYFENLDKFSWIKSYKKPVLGICAGMQIIGLIFGGKLEKNKEIGITEVNGKLKINKVYGLHNFSVSAPEGFEVLLKSDKCIQAFKKENLVGHLFHPEVMNKELIINFSNN